MDIRLQLGNYPMPRKDLGSEENGEERNISYSKPVAARSLTDREGRKAGDRRCHARAVMKGGQAGMERDVPVANCGLDKGE